MAIGNVNVTQRLIRCQAATRMRIPGSFTPADFMGLTKLLQEIREDIDDALRQLCGKDYAPDQEPKELHIRLNESDKSFPLPIFAGWVESDDVRERRREWNQPDPGLARFGDDVYSEIYGEAFRYANNPDPLERFRYRDWGAGEILEKRSGEKATDPKSGNLFQTCLAIVIEDHAVGTLVVGFRHKPEDPLLRRTQDILGEWAREPQAGNRGGLGSFLKKFELGGPPLANSNWVDLL